MLVVDQINKGDGSLRMVAWGVAAGLGLLLAGLWRTQVVQGEYYRGVRRPSPFVRYGSRRPAAAFWTGTGRPWLTTSRDTGWTCILTSWSRSLRPRSDGFGRRMLRRAG